MTNGASVKATQCEFSENGSSGMVVKRESKGIFTDCSFHHNDDAGVFANGDAPLVELRGEQTEIHHNRHYGFYVTNATINIYIPSRSITALIHDNGRDLYTDSRAKIQSQLSSSSLELTVIHEGEAPEDEEDEEDY